MGPSIPALAVLSLATIWLLNHTRIGCLIGNHADPVEVTSDDPEADLIHWHRQCPHCGKVWQTETLEPQWNNGNGTLYARANDDAASKAQ